MTAQTTIPRAERARPTWLKRITLPLALVLAILGLALSLTIPLTMPTMLLMVARIGATELNLWLLALNVIALVLSWIALRGARSRASRFAQVALACSLIGVALSLIPAAQLPDAASEAEIAMQSGLGKDYASHIPANLAQHMRPSPFSLGDYIMGISTGDAALTRDIPYRTIEGHTLLLDRYDPPGAGPHPGLLVIHGGSWRNGDKGQYTPASYYFAARGYVVYDIQYRLSSQGAQFPAQLEDVECALGYMRSHAVADKLDPERVVTFGRSAGAHLALLAAYRASRDPIPAGCSAPATVKATVAYYAPTDLRDNYVHPAEPDLIDVRKVMSDFLGGSPDRAPAQYESATPQHWLDRPVPPTLLLQGGSDQIVLPHNAQKLADPLRAAHDKVVTISIPWAGHGFDAVFQGPSSQLALYYWERFMTYTLASP